MTLVTPAPAYILARAGWMPTLVIWHAAGRFIPLEGAPCGDYAAALAASWLRPAESAPLLSNGHDGDAELDKLRRDRASAARSPAPLDRRGLVPPSSFTEAAVGDHLDVEAPAETSGQVGVERGIRPRNDEEIPGVAGSHHTRSTRSRDEIRH